MNKSRLHILVLLFSLTVTLFLFPREKLYAASSGTCGAEGDNLTWELDDEGTLTISGIGEMGSWRYYKSPWNNYTSEIRKVVIGDGVTGICNYAFLDCSNLSDVEISDSVTYIGAEAFGSCTSLEEIEIPGSVTTIDDSFSNCSNLKKVVLSEGLIAIGEGTFAYCESLQEIVIPDCVTSIGRCAFENCTSLQEIVVPEGVTLIGDDAFNHCYSLQEIVIPEGVTSIGDNAFFACFSLQEIVIPKGVTSIGNRAFCSCNSLQEAEISEGVTSIGEYAFENCMSLQKVVIPESVTLIGKNAFFGCEKLQAIIIPKNVTSIGNSAFQNCRSLREVVIPESVTSIGEGAFKGCGLLTHIIIPKKLYDELDLKNVFEISSEGIFYVYSFTSDGNGTTNLKSIDLKSGKVVLKVVPNENFVVNEIYRIDSSGTAEPMDYYYDNGECYFEIPKSEMNNLFIHATFKRVSANVTFCSEDGTKTLQSGTYKINEIPSYTADIPVKEPDGDNTYVFAGWSDGTVTYGVDDQLPKVTDDVTYTAVFEEVPQSIPPVSLYKLSSIEGEDKRADIIFRINRNEDDENCISYFRSVAVDDVVLANGTQYSVEKGSTVITLKSDYLKTLSEGEHTITVNFKDGTATAAFNNLKRVAESIPATGETAIKATVGVVLVLVAVSGLAVVLIKRKKSEK